jgi:hypothetical protein
MSATAFQRMRREQAAKEQVEKAPKTLDQMTVAELKVIAKEKGIEGYDKMKKPMLIEVIQKPAETSKEPENKEPENKDEDTGKESSEE